MFCDNLNPLQKAAVKILESIGSRLWGFKPNMMHFFVAEYGPVKSVFWFVKNMPGYERILKRRGPTQTHLASTAISTLHGCPYCTYGHAYAMQLHYFNDTDRLFPLTEDELIKLHELPEADVFSRLTAALTDAGLHTDVQWLDKLASLRSMSSDEQANAARENRDDADMRHLMGMFAVLNSCGITHEVIPDEAHDPINQDKQLRARYAAARAC